MAAATETAALHDIGGVGLECLRLPGAPPGEREGGPTLVLLHEGLGSVAMWKGFPAELVGATGCDVLVYSRRGYGRSDPRPGSYGPDYMHYEAQEVLPALLRHFGIERPVLVGHSDGASIALIAGGGTVDCAGIVAISLHVFVEDLSIASIEAAKRAFQTTALRDRLARYHRDPDHAFAGWNDGWLQPAFRDWNIEEFLPAIVCPVLAIQGADDEYGTLAQVAAVERSCGGPVQRLVLDHCGHSPHRDRPEATLSAIAEFVRKSAV